MRQSFPAAELGVLAVEVLVLHEEDVQHLWTNVGHESQHHHDTLAETDVRTTRHSLHPAVPRRVYLFQPAVFALLPEVKLYGDGQ